MNFSSFRRHYLDQMLTLTDFSGDVLDVGGKKGNKKGNFRPPMDRCRSWRYVNIDASTAPDFLASADAIPLADAAVDWVLLAETLEHLEEPERALREAARLLRPGGRLILSVPFLYPVHADPHDYQRWTPQKFHRELARAGFGSIEVRPMGGLFAVVGDVFEAFCQAHYTEGKRPAFAFRLLRRLLRSVALPYLLRADAHLPYRDAVTGGYFVSARKA